MKLAALAVLCDIRPSPRGGAALARHVRMVRAYHKTKKPNFPHTYLVKNWACSSFRDSSGHAVLIHAPARGATTTHLSNPLNLVALIFD